MAAAAIKEGAKEAAKQGANEVAKQAAMEVAKQGAKEVAKQGGKEAVSKVERMFYNRCPSGHTRIQLILLKRGRSLDFDFYSLSIIFLLKLSL